MKKFLLSILLLSIALTVACGKENNKPSEIVDPDHVDPIEEPDPVVDPNTFEPVEIALPNELLSVSSNDLVSMRGFHSVVSSTIFTSSNKILLGYVLECAIGVKYTQENDVTSGDSTISNSFKSIHLQLTNNRKIIVWLLEDNVLLLNYYKNNELKYSFTGKDENIHATLSSFCVMGVPLNEWWCATPVATSYINDPAFSEVEQEYVIKNYIRSFSPLSEHYQYGTMFSGSIIEYFGKFNNYYAVIVDGCGINYLEEETVEEIAGIKFIYHNSNRIYLVRNDILTLEDAYNKNILTKDDLKEISRLLNKDVTKFTLGSRVDAITKIEAFVGVSRESSAFINSLSHDDSNELFNNYFKNVTVTNDENIIKSLKDKYYIVANSLVINTMDHQYTINVLANGAILFYYFNNQRRYEFASTTNTIDLNSFNEALRGYETDNSPFSFTLSYTEMANETSNCNDYRGFYKARSEEELISICTKLNIRKDVSFPSWFYKDHGIILFVLADGSKNGHYFRFRVSGDTLKSNYTLDDKEVNTKVYYVFVEVSIEELNMITKLEIKDSIRECVNE